LNVVREHSRRELSTKFNADAPLLPSIRVVRATWSGGTASWDDTTESLKSTGEPVKEALPLVLIGIGVTYSGSVGALSLAVRIEDIHGARVYSNRGEIQVLTKISGGKFVPVPKDQYSLVGSQSWRTLGAPSEPRPWGSAPPRSARG